MEGLGIDAKELVKSYGGKRVVDRLTLQVPQGCIFGLLGPNGAGKSTTIGMITGLLKPDEGQVSILGRPMHANALDVRRLVGVVPDNLGLFEHLSIWEHFDIMREVWGIDKVEFMRRVDDLLELLGLASEVDKQARHCSYGMRKKISLAMALIPNPKVLILDEPFEGLDPIMSRTVEVSLRKASERGLTILITTHVLTAMNDLLVKYGILSSGKLVVCGDMQTLREQGISLQDAYLQEFGVVQEPELSWLG